MLVTLDGAGASHPVVAHLSTLNAAPARQMHYSIGFDLDGRTRTAIGLLPESAWEPALDAAGAGRADVDVAELTGLLRRGPDGDKLTGWSADMRVIVRREPISPGVQILTTFRPEWRETYRSEFKVSTAADGHLALRAKRH